MLGREDFMLRQQMAFRLNRRSELEDVWRQMPDVIQMKIAELYGRLLARAAKTAAEGSRKPKGESNDQ